jgi:hypothetical protein
VRDFNDQVMAYELSDGRGWVHDHDPKSQSTKAVKVKPLFNAVTIKTFWGTHRECDVKVGRSVSQSVSQSMGGESGSRKCYGWENPSFKNK